MVVQYDLALSGLRVQKLVCTLIYLIHHLLDVEEAHVISSHGNIMGTRSLSFTSDGIPPALCCCCPCRYIEVLWDSICLNVSAGYCCTLMYYLL